MQDEETNYREINKASWNNKLKVHLESDFYDLKGFKETGFSLNGIEVGHLGNVFGKDILHLQCHFGQNSISLAKLGANVTAVDISDESISAAKTLAQEMNVKVEFICTDVYSIGKFTDKKFDLIYVSYGAIEWLPDMDRWASIISRYLKAEGRLVLVEFHPLVYIFDDEIKQVKYSYFRKEAIIEEESGSYAEPGALINQQNVTWIHNLSSVIGSLINNGLQIQCFDEYDYSPYNCFSGMTEVSEKKFQFLGQRNKLPIVYALTAVKKNWP